MVYAWHSAASLIMQQGPDKKNWSMSREAVLWILKSRWFNRSMAATIMANVCVIVAEADIGASCNTDAECNPVGLYLLNWCFLSAYILETGMRIYVQRWTFPTSRWNMLDLVIVLAGLFDMVIVRSALRTSTGGSVPDLMIFRLARGLRMLRAFHLAQFFPQLRFMILSLNSAMMAMAWGFGMIILVMLTLSVLLVEVIRPLQVEGMENEWCHEAFQSVGSGMLFFVQTMMAGDSWGSCTIPTITQYPATSVIFIGGLVLVQLGFMNLILAAAVDAANEHHEANLEKREAERLHEKIASSHQLLGIMRRIDTDSSGCIDFQELLAAYDGDLEMQQLLTLLDIDKDDLQRLFGYMDTDGSGEVAYEEFVRSIQKAQSRDVRMQLLALMLHLSEVTPILKAFMETFAKSMPLQAMMGGFASQKSGGSCKYDMCEACSLDDPTQSLEEHAQGCARRAAAGITEVFQQIKAESQTLREELHKKCESLEQSVGEATSRMRTDLLLELKRFNPPAPPREAPVAMAAQIPRGGPSTAEPTTSVEDQDSATTPSAANEGKALLAAPSTNEGKASKARKKGGRSPRAKSPAGAPPPAPPPPPQLPPYGRPAQAVAMPAPVQYVELQSTTPMHKDASDNRLLRLETDLRRAELRMQQQEELQSSLKQLVAMQTAQAGFPQSPAAAPQASVGRLHERFFPNPRSPSPLAAAQTLRSVASIGTPLHQGWDPTLGRP